MSTAGPQPDAMEQLLARAHVDHRAHRQAARVDAVDPRGDHLVADPHVRLQRDEVEIQAAGAKAAHDALAAGALDHRADAGGPIGDQLDLGVGPGRQDHPADQAVDRHHRLVPLGGLPAGPQHQGALERPVVDKDHVGGAQRPELGADVIERPGEPLQVLLEPPDLHLPLAIPRHLLLEPLVLLLQRAAQPELLAETADQVVAAVDQPAQRRDGPHHQDSRRLLRPSGSGSCAAIRNSCATSTRTSSQRVPRSLSSWVVGGIGTGGR